MDKKQDKKYTLIRREDNVMIRGQKVLFLPNPDEKAKTRRKRWILAAAIAVIDNSVAYMT